MNLVVIADIHGQGHHLGLLAEELKAADLVLLTGDITNFGRRREAEQILEAVAQWAPEILAVPGNCDYPEVEAVLTERNCNLDGRTREHNGLRFIGLGGSLPAPGGTPNEYSEGELDERLNQAVQATDMTKPFLLISHQPPINTCADQVSPGQHVGSLSVRRFIEANQPMACLTGHIHEGIGVDTIGSAQIVNPGPWLKGHFALISYQEGGLKIELHQLDD